MSTDRGPAAVVDSSSIRRGTVVKQSSMIKSGIGLLIGLALAVTACGGNSNSTSGTKTGGILVVGRTADIDLLDPHKATAFQTVQSLEQIYDTLVGFDKDLNLIPRLATKWGRASRAKR